CVTGQYCVAKYEVRGTVAGQIVGELRHAADVQADSWRSGYDDVFVVGGREVESLTRAITPGGRTGHARQRRCCLVDREAVGGSVSRAAAAFSRMRAHGIRTLGQQSGQ